MSSKKQSLKHNETPVAPTVQPLTELLRLPAGEVDLGGLDPSATPGFSGSKADAPAATEALAPELGDLQERLYAAGRVAEGEAKKILIVLQGMDTSGKGGAIRHAIGMVDPQGVRIKAFKAPSEEERAHDFLWRIERELPRAGHHRDLRPLAVRGRAHRSGQQAGRGVGVEPTLRRDQCLRREAGRRRHSHDQVLPAHLRGRTEGPPAARLDDPTKHWKYNPGDVDERAKWPAYQEAYAAVLEQCSTQHAPWYVIPSDRKWYRNWAVAQLLVEHLRALNPQWPVADFDVEQEKARVAAS